MSKNIIYILLLSSFLYPITQDDIIETYSGIRPLIEDFKEASKVTRDYVFDLNCENNNLPLFLTSIIFKGSLRQMKKGKSIIVKILGLFFLSTFASVNSQQIIDKNGKH